MASKLIVEVCKIHKIIPHNNADRLEIAQVKGWNCIVKKGQYKPGDMILFIPPDSILPHSLIEKYGVGNYLGGKDKNKVRAARLRGEMSAGLIVDVDNPDWKLGQNIAEELGITKYEPPVHTKMGDKAKHDPLFPRYTDIENLRNYDDIFKEGEIVIVTEKIDGSSSRYQSRRRRSILSLFKTQVEWLCGSHNVNRKKPSKISNIRECIYWYPYTQENLKEMLYYYIKSHKEVQCITLFGELYGAIRGGMKSMHYNRPEEICYAAFDIEIDGKYLDYDDFYSLCDTFDVPTAPLISRMPYNKEKILALANGMSGLSELYGEPHIKEGVVVKPEKERYDSRVGRVIMKVHGDDYLDLKNQRENKGEEVDIRDE